MDFELRLRRPHLNPPMIVTTSREPVAFDFAPLRGCQVIAIDGDNGAGKSALADELKMCLGGTVISVDEHLAGDGAPYLDQLNFSSLSSALSSAPRPVIVEGILLLDVLTRLEVAADYLILIRKQFVGFTWHEPLPAEIVAYYQRRAPVQIANLCLTMKISMSRSAEGK